MQAKIVNSIEETESIENKIVYDIDNGVECVKNFIRKTVPLSKDFKKLVKKQEGRSEKDQKKLVFDFVNKNLKNTFNYEVSRNFFVNDELNFLNEEVLNTYIFGTFVTGHSKKLEENHDKIYARILLEMSTRAANERKQRS